VAGPKPPSGSRGCIERSTVIADIRQPGQVGLVLSSIHADAAENTTGKMRQFNVATRAAASDPCPVAVPIDAAMRLSHCCHSCVAQAMLLSSFLPATACARSPLRRFPVVFYCQFARLVLLACGFALGRWRSLGSALVSVSALGFGSRHLGSAGFFRARCRLRRLLIAPALRAGLWFPAAGPLALVPVRPNSGLRLVS
jgi:hypothetical protein